MFCEGCNSPVFFGRSFYEKAFGFKKRFIHENGLFAEMEMEGAALHFAANEAVKANLPKGFQENNPSNLPAGIEVCLVTDNVTDAFAKAINAGAVAYTEPKVMFWGQTIAYVRDLDGILIEIGNSSW
ncbi:VOC family protein [Rivularia sp. UHCC 0363]|uniref:VOC family protein n=1 Tax=Rivularia sp. UHCC 0363 TaxID=3110244 RepID=UPI002B211E83|nr:VOC family protein [Rivularia sp. UHCC 0363]MEA5598257.1 VOC family protein [Rivularia sp. UHCC 0363]